LAHNLKMVVVAEGVESAQQAALLTEMRCECGQGYHFERPIPAAEASKLIASGRRW
jgi:EAL domain-containing protein (putative c-di-GMP-specific phosphodiesterase class I)